MKPSMSELWELSAHELLAGYAARSFSPREVVDSLAGRIERLNPSLGAFTEVCLDRARAEADVSRSGPLAGVPFAVKDLFDSEGVRSAYGSRMFAAHVPDADAPAVASLRAAGAILIGKTQTHEFAWGITSVNDAMGSSRNPWDLTRVPGGSSGGSAVALAARMVPLALGTDTGGSIRIPSAFCGVTGLKPTYGRVDLRGVWPLAPTLDHAGPMARTPEDLALALAVLDGDEAASRAPRAGPGATEGRATAGPGALDTADADAARASLDAATIVAGPDLPNDAIAMVERLGARVVERPLPDPKRAEAVFATVQLWEAARVHEQAGLHPDRADDYGHDVRVRLEAAAQVTAGEHLEATRERELIRAQLARALADGALLMTPVATTPPIEAAQRDRDANRAFRAAVMQNTVPHNLAGIPSCAVRAGFDEHGLPTAIQFAAAQWRDAKTLQAASAFFAATPEIQQPWPA
jgi:aspartyl-tRNA(Asn)/glutamyl-tRNA(Gln) amidotransferase subunit A